MSPAGTLAPPALFLPGWGLGCGPLATVLEGSGWQLLDLPGIKRNPQGNLQGNPQENPPAHFDSAVEALCACLPPSCHLGGWSLGALLALAAAARAPERIISLTLVAATPSFVQRPAWPHGLSPAALQDFAARVAKAGAGALPRFIALFCQGDHEARAAARRLGQQASPPAQELLEAGLVWLGEADLREAVPHITCPVTLIHGETDPLMPLAAARWLQEQLPAARLQLLPGKAHAPFSPDPALFLEQLPRP
ncbi:MAG: alpha/beta fold hydrolase [Azovibrio sp.]|uniref:alpha/beta fold hydrolase n=1 Tax=Azovibrio sp. TaxID=1872673 RepID=UPI003C795565